MVHNLMAFHGMIQILADGKFVYLNLHVVMQRLLYRLLEEILKCDLGFCLNRT